ncbi:MAG: hypothetical protein A4C66_03180 [Nitrospira sp. HN-bin3]|uniref:terminase family protein n=1 Tax=Nitrospira cf. moscoviensis SBR1015 TaxID=96242 RepID=UPI000A0AEC1F|nr:terminase family protein [Nitrospira cf. moscoviensis SBR1015]OQW37049.1 MAG: hypothetical protein A4C66_03180 [Nitrospira sp. HN-bin3]
MKHDVAWKPHPGPQTKFLANPAFEVLYGGAAGGGKTDCLLYGGLRQVHIPGFRALFLRKTFPELREVMDRTHAVFRRLGAEWKATDKRWQFPSGAFYEFGYLESYTDAMQYQGQEFQYIAYDELGLVPEERIWLFLMSRCRSTNPDIRAMMRASANPGGAGHGWIRKRFISVCPPDGSVVTIPSAHGFPPLTRAFVQSKVWDNPTLVENNPQYISILQGLPDLLRRQLLEGDWSAGSGLAFEELNETVHFVPPRSIEPWENVFAAFDWGYSHNFSVGLYLVQADGAVLKMDTILGRRMIPEEIVERVKERFLAMGVPFHRLQYTVSGSDVKMQDRARGSFGPSVLEQFMTAGWTLINADQSRVAGYQNLLHYLSWGKDRPPRLRFMDTPGNRKCFEQLQSLVVDPDSPNDVLKVDTDPTTGEGGDDMYDETRMALMSRPIVPRKPSALQDRINQERIFAKPQTQEPSQVPWARSHPGLVSRNRTERVV